MYMKYHSYLFLIICFSFFVEAKSQTTAPSKLQLMEYLRSKLLKSNIHDNSAFRKVHPGNTYSDILIDTTSCTMTMLYKSNDKQVIFFGNLDAGSLGRDIVEYKDYSFATIGRLNVSSVNGKTARVWYNADGSIDNSLANIARFFYDRFIDIKELERIEKAIVALIKVCGGKDSVELF